MAALSGGGGPDDPFDLARFTAAQAGTFDTALGELAHGAKRSHWMWFVFPQLAGLGTSAMARRYAIRSREEAAAYLAHPVLGPRLAACCEALLALPPRITAHEVFGGVDTMKLRSSMTLFAAVAPADAPFRRVLARFFDGEADGETLRRLD